ncbi:MAG TPA: hypothetical protein VII06_23440 [Chloroflexota bacterium]
MRHQDDGRDLDAALVALIDGALRAADEGATLPPPERARLLAQALAAGLRELIRAPLREALQAGYELGWRAAEAQRQAASAAEEPATRGSDAAGPDSPARQTQAAADAGSRRAPEPGGQQALDPAGAMDAAPTEPESAAPATASAGATTHQVHVEVKAVPSFSAVNRLHAAVAGAPGVSDATMVAFRDGRLTLRVEHPDGAALAAAIQALEVGPLRVLAAARDRVELTLAGYAPPTIRRSLRRPAANR